MTRGLQFANAQAAAPVNVHMTLGGAGRSACSAALPDQPGDEPLARRARGRQPVGRDDARMADELAATDRQLRGVSTRSITARTTYSVPGHAQDFVAQGRTGMTRPTTAVIPWTYEPRPDTRTTNVRVGMWLFLASEAMLFASLLSAYVLLRGGASAWPEAGTLLDPQAALVNTALLALATVSVWLSHRHDAPPRAATLLAGAGWPPDSSFSS